MHLMFIIVLGMFLGTVALFLGYAVAICASFVLALTVGGVLIMAINVLEFIEDTWRKLTK